MDSVTRFKDLLADLNLKKGASSKAIASFKDRPLVCTPYNGNHGTISGWVICVNGSPPRGTMLIKILSSSQLDAFYIADDKCKNITGKRQLETILNFFDAQLKKKEEAFTIQNNVS